MEWHLIVHSRSRIAIGTIGFLNGRVAVVVTFCADKDMNNDGEVSFGERFGNPLFSMEGRALTEVATQAYSRPDLVMKDPSGMRRLHGRAIVNFAAGMMLDGVYITSFQAGIARACGAIAGRLVAGSAARFFVAKGMEASVKAVYRAAVH